MRECRHGQVRVQFGNIIRVEGDVMVIPANNRLAGREGLDEKMQLAAGEELRARCTEIAVERRKEGKQPCGVGEAVTTPGFNLPAEHLVHVVGPDCRRPNQDNFRRELLLNSYNAMFEEISKIKSRETLVTPPTRNGCIRLPSQRRGPYDHGNNPRLDGQRRGSRGQDGSDCD